MRKFGLWLARALLLAIVIVFAWTGGGLAMSKNSNSDEATRGWVITVIVVIVAIIGVWFLYGDARRTAHMKQFLGALVLVWFASALFTPVFQSSQEARPQTACLSNVKQLAIATHIYVLDFDEVFPPTASWHDDIRPYAKHEYRCREARTDYSYGMNTALGSVRAADINSPDKTVLYFEMDSDVPNAHGTAKDAVTRHTGWFVIALADGSAKNTIDFPAKWSR